MSRSHRQKAQTMTIAVVAMVSMLGAVSLVVDAGVYFVIKAQLQNAADAAALAAVWYDPACDSTQAGWNAAGCQPVPASHPATCPPASDPIDIGPCTAATQAVAANWGVALSLCAGPASTLRVKVDVYPAANVVSSPPIRPYVVTLACDAQHWFAQVLPGVAPTMHINASSAAALGWLQPNGGVIGGPQPNPAAPLPLAGRLVPTT